MAPQTNSRYSWREKRDPRIWSGFATDSFCINFSPVDHVEENLEKSRAEAGVIQYDLSKDAKKPNTYNLWQRYASPEAVKEHMSRRCLRRSRRCLLLPLCKQPTVVHTER